MRSDQLWRMVRDADDADRLPVWIAKAMLEDIEHVMAALEWAHELLTHGGNLTRREQEILHRVRLALGMISPRNNAAP